MQTFQYHITIDESKVQELYALLTNLRYVQRVEVLPTATATNGTVEEPAPYYTPNQLAYSVEEIRAIADRFPKNKKWTAQDLDKYFPPDLKVKVQIIKNKLYIMPTPRENHQFIVAELLMTMGVYAKQNKLGQVYPAPLDVEFDENNVFQPDVLFIKIERKASAVNAEGKIVEAPDLVVEIWSPSNRKKEREDKRDIYESFGVAEYWSIFPKKQQISVETLNEAGKYEVFSEAKKQGIVKSKILEGFEIDITELMPTAETEAEPAPKAPKPKKKKGSQNKS